MEDAHGKEICLQYTTVKVPGQRPRGSKSIPNANNNTLADNIGNLTLNCEYAERPGWLSLAGGRGWDIGNLTLNCEYAERPGWLSLAGG